MQKEEIRKKHKVPTEKVEVVLTTKDGNKTRGTLFLKAGMRILDVINDERRFLPFENAAGLINIINKEEIYCIEPQAQYTYNQNIRPWL